MVMIGLMLPECVRVSVSAFVRAYACMCVFITRITPFSVSVKTHNENTRIQIKKKLIFFIFLSKH